jgi:hypothetical protein
MAGGVDKVLKPVKACQNLVKRGYVRDASTFDQDEGASKCGQLRSSGRPTAQAALCIALPSTKAPQETPLEQDHVQ